MSGTRVRRRLVRRWAIAVVCFAIVALVFTSQVWIDFAYAGRRLSWARAFAIALAGWEPWAALAPFVVALAERFPFTRDRWGRIHRSTIVNVDKVRELLPAFHGESVVVMQSGRRLRCSRSYGQRLKHALRR